MQPLRLRAAVAIRKRKCKGGVIMPEIFTWTITLRNGKVLRAAHRPFHFYIDEGDEKDSAEAES